MIEIPQHFFETYYDSAQIPGVAQGLKSGANCQHFCYEVLRYFGFETGPLRSSDLWEDTLYTVVTETAQPLDLVLFNRDFDFYGAHVGLYVSGEQVLHLSKKNGKPVVWDINTFQKYDEYKTTVGLKRPIKRI